MNNKSLSACGLALALLAAGTAHAQIKPITAGTILAKARLSQAGSDVDVDGLTLKADKRLTLDASATYFFRRDLAIEASYTLGHSRSLSTGGVNVGTFKPSALGIKAQYHFATGGNWRPYVGLGLQYTHFGIDSPAITSADQSAVGAVAQVGVDIPVSGDWFANIDLQKSYARTDITVAGTPSKLKYEPWTLGVGVGRRF